jgi:hypothetical protein
MEKPGVTDDISEVWRRTIDLNPMPVQRPYNQSQEHMRTMHSFMRTGFHTRNDSLNNTVSPGLAPLSNRIQEQRERKLRSKSNVSQQPTGKKEPNFKSLKLIGGQTITLPTRERFNEEVEQVIQENKEKTALSQKNVASLSQKDRGGSEKSHMTAKSKKTLTATELKEYFKQNEEEIRSKFSQMSKASIKSGLKAKMYKRLEREAEAAEARSLASMRQSQSDLLKDKIEQLKKQHAVQIEVAGGKEKAPIDDQARNQDETMESSKADNRKEGDDDLDELLSQVPTEMISQIPSQAPTEQLAAEYKKLMDEYDQLCVGNQKMEQQVQSLKKQLD